MKLLLATLLLVLAASPTGPPTDTPATTSSDEELEEFIPSEELPADSAISFPVDI